jgi:hypothetical protein
MLWRPKRGGVGPAGVSSVDDENGIRDAKQIIDVDLCNQLIDILTITRDNLDDNDSTFKNTTNIRFES